MSKRQTAATGPEAIGRPAEETAARELAAAVEKFNAESFTRSSVSDQDGEALGNLVAAAETYEQAAQAAWRAMESPIDGDAKEPPAVVTSVHVRVLDYVNRNRATMNIDITTPDGPSQIATPALESATMRQAIHRQGQEIVEHIEKAIATGYKRCADHRAAQSKQLAQVEFWMKKPIIRKLVDAMTEMLDTLPDASIAGLLETLSGVQRRIVNDTERVGRQTSDPLPTAIGHWRRWLPVAREILNTQGEGKTRGAA